MRDAERLSILRGIEDERKSRVIAYVIGDRRGLETQVAFEQLAVLYDHLTDMGPQKQIDLFLYGPGGLTLAAYSIVHLLREFCDRLAVLVPFRALSAATLISLGADEIVMGRLGQLSPIDPTLTGPYNPPAPVQTHPGRMQLLPLSVEDVSGYINLARDEFKLKTEESMLKVLETLAGQVHPIALGAVQRSRQQIGMLAKKLMSTHWPKDRTAEIDDLTEVLTRKLGSHDYIIGRREARDVLKLPVTFPSAEFERALWSLFCRYQDVLELRTAYIQEAVLGANPEATATFRRAFVESGSMTHVFETRRSLKRITITQQGVPMPGVQESVQQEGWVEYRDPAPTPAPAPPAEPAR